MTGSRKIIIPDDYDYISRPTCRARIFLPDSKLWRGIMVGALKGLTDPYIWDHTTGDVSEAIDVAHIMINDINYTLCSG